MWGRFYIRGWIPGILGGVRPSRWIVHHRHQLRCGYHLRRVAWQPAGGRQRTRPFGSWHGCLRPPNHHDRRWYVLTRRLRSFVSSLMGETCFFSWRSGARRTLHLYKQVLSLAFVFVCSPGCEDKLSLLPDDDVVRLVGLVLSISNSGRHGGIPRVPAHR